MTQLRKESLKITPRPVYLRKRGIKTTKFIQKTPKIPGAVTVYGESVCPKKFTGKALDSNFAESYLGRGSVYFMLEKYSEALSEINKCIKLDPAIKDAYLTRGNLYTKLAELSIDTKERDEYSAKAKSDFERGHVGVSPLNDI